jgi:small GTP-binding protein
MKLPKIFVFGLDRAGKTFLTNSLVAKTIEEEYKPTLGFNVQSLDISDFGVRIWDAPGQKRFRNLWGRGYKDADLLMYVVDVSDAERFEDSRIEFDTVIKNMNNSRIPILFCYHKMDIPDAQANLQIAKKVFTASLLNRTYVIVETSIHDPESLHQVKNQFIQLLKRTRYAVTELEKTTKKIVKESRTALISPDANKSHIESKNFELQENQLDDLPLDLPIPPKPSGKLPTAPSSKLPMKPPTRASAPPQKSIQPELPPIPEGSSNEVFEFVRKYGHGLKTRYGIEMNDLYTLLSSYEEFQQTKSI